MFVLTYNNYLIPFLRSCFKSGRNGNFQKMLNIKGKGEQKVKTFKKYY